ncbi:MAG TPA: hypothetical protein VHY31_21245, partial [Streptosporangiaceae bacterium]|nr:hypothetical protein [Streptosporangiaceae bacterium]
MAHPLAGEGCSKIDGSLVLAGEHQISIHRHGRYGTESGAQAAFPGSRAQTRLTARPFGGVFHDLGYSCATSARHQPGSRNGLPREPIAIGSLAAYLVI